MHPAVLQLVARCFPRLALQTPIHSWWIPWTHYRRATNRVCMKTLLLQSSDGSNRRRTQHLPRSSARKQCMLSMLYLLTILPPRWHLRSVRSEALTQISRQTTIVQMMNCISGCQGAATIAIDVADEIDESDTIPTASRWRWAAAELERFDLGTSDVDWYKGEAGDDADADEEEPVLRANERSTQNLEDWGHSTRKCVNWKLNFRPVKSDDGEVNAEANNVSETKSVL